MTKRLWKKKGDYIRFPRTCLIRSFISFPGAFVRLESELTYYDVGVQHISPYTMETLLMKIQAINVSGCEYIDLQFHKIEDICIS